MKYFVSIQRATKELPSLWKKYFTVGEFWVHEMNEKEKYAILRLKDFEINKEKCYNIMGFSANVVRLLTGSKNTTYEETKCTLDGDDYHEFVLRW